MVKSFINNVKKKIKSNYKTYLIWILAIILVANILIPQNQNSFNTISGNFERSAAAFKSADYYPGIAGGFAPDVENRQIRKNANLVIETENYDISKAKITELSKNYNAIVLYENENKNREGIRNVYYNIKVKSDVLNAFILELKQLGDVQNLNIYSDDVTKSFIDYSERLKRYETQIEKYKSYLDRENISIKEEVEIQTRIDSLEDSIFYIKKQLNNLKEDVEYSQVSLTLREKPTFSSNLNFLGISDLVITFLKAIEQGLILILKVLGYVLPFVILYGFYRLILRFKNN